MGPRADGIAAQQTILDQMDDGIRKHKAAADALAACVLPTSTPPSCGASPNVAHVHHMALVTLVNGQTLMMQVDRNAVASRMQDDNSRFERAIAKAAGHATDDENDIEVDRKRGLLHARGWPAITLSVAAAGVLVFFAVRQIARMESEAQPTIPARSHAPADRP